MFIPLGFGVYPRVRVDQKPWISQGKKHNLGTTDPSEGYLMLSPLDQTLVLNSLFIITAQLWSLAGIHTDLSACGKFTQPQILPGLVLPLWLTPLHLWHLSVPQGHPTVPEITCPVFRAHQTLPAAPPIMSSAVFFCMLIFLFPNHLICFLYLPLFSYQHWPAVLLFSFSSPNGHFPPSHPPTALCGFPVAFRAKVAIALPC